MTVDRLLHTYAYSHIYMIQQFTLLHEILFKVICKMLQISINGHQEFSVFGQMTICQRTINALSFIVCV